MNQEFEGRSRGSFLPITRTRVSTVSANQGADDDPVDFEAEYHITDAIPEVPIKIYLKQEEIEVLPSTSWMKLSDSLVEKKYLPVGTLFRIYPTDGSVTDQDHEDLSYTFDWEAGKQYWYEIVYEAGRDRADESIQVKMIDGNDQVDSLVVPRGATAQRVKDLWKSLLDVPPDVDIQVQTGNGEEFYWAYVTLKDTTTYTIRTPSLYMDVTIFPGSNTFEAEQISRLLGYKLPPAATGQVISCHGGGSIVQFGEDMVPLGLKILKVDLLSWNLNGLILKAPQPTTWWVPYHLDRIRRYGNSVNSAIPADPNEAEFPPTPWPEEVVIRIKSHPPMPDPPTPALVGGAPLALPPLDPTVWHGPALGQAQPISADAASLVNYQSANSIRTVDVQEEDPTDPQLLALRGESEGDQLVHQMISWTTRKDYPLMIGISLPISDMSETGAHEGQLWEQASADAEQWLIANNHMDHVYAWLLDKLTSRSSQREAPVGTPAADGVTVRTFKDGKAGHILFTPKEMFATPVKDMDVRVLIEYEDGYMRVATMEAYTIKMISDDFMALTQNQWDLFPIDCDRRLIDGTVVHKTTSDYWVGQSIKASNAQVELPPEILEERGRGSEIHTVRDQDLLLQYWAWAQLPLEVGIMLPQDKHVIEFWMWTKVQQEPDDDTPFFYHRVIKDQCLERLREQSPQAASLLLSIGDDFSARLRYLANGLRI
jgi:hypothetical protein